MTSSNRSFTSLAAGIPVAVAAVFSAFPALAAPGPESKPPPAPAAATPDCPCATAEKGAEERLYESGTLMVRLSTGPGYLLGKGDPDTEMKSFAGGLGMTIGAFLLDGFALHADISLLHGFDPDFTAGGSIDNTTSLTFSASSFHLGASYYLAPLRLYGSLGFGVGLARMTGYVHAEDDSVALVGTEYGKVGPSLQIQLGKEWRVSSGWGMGVAAEYEFLSVDPREDDGNVTIDIAHHWGIRFSATFAGD